MPCNTDRSRLSAKMSIDRAENRAMISMSKSKQDGGERYNGMPPPSATGPYWRCLKCRRRQLAAKLGFLMFCS